MSSLPEQVLARPYAFEQVRDRPATQEFRPAFELSAGTGMPDSLLEPARAEARASGYAAGWAEGIQDARAHMANDVLRSQQHAAALDTERAAGLACALRALDAAAAALEARVVPSVEGLEDTVVAMAMQIAEALVGHELIANERLGLDALARVLKLAPHDEPVTVELSPNDFAAVVGSSELLAAQTHRPVTVIASPAVRDGDAVARCGATRIDGQLAPALERVRKVLGQ
jgi:flagellar assembly protein FliH